MKNQRKFGLFFSTMQIFVSSFIGIMFTPFLIKSLGEIEYGLYQLLYATVGYLALLDFGLGSTITQFLLKSEGKNEDNSVSAEAVISTCLKIYGVIVIVIFVLMIVVANCLKEFYPASITEYNYVYARKLFLIMGVTTLITLFSHALSGIETAYEQYIVTKGVRLLQQVARVIILLILFLKGQKALAIVYVDLLLAVLLLFFDLFYCKYVLHVCFFKGKWNQALFKRILKFSIFVFLQIIVTQINNSVDRVLLGRYASLEMVALYAVAMQLYNMFNSFGGIIPGISVPQISRVVYSNSTREEITDFCVGISRYQFMILMLLTGGFMLYGKQFVSLWAPEYESTRLWIIILLIVLPQILEFIETPIFFVMKAKELQGVRSIIIGCVAVGNLFLSVFLLRYMPIYGCAVGTFVSFIIGNNILTNIYYHKRVGVNILRYFRGLFARLLPAWILSICIGIIFNFLSGAGWISLILKCVLYTVIYGCAMIFIGMNKSEKAMVYKIINKVKKI